MRSLILVSPLLLNPIATWRAARIFGALSGLAFHARASQSAEHHHLQARRHVDRAIQLAVTVVASAPTGSTESVLRLQELRVLQSIGTHA